MIVVFTRLRLLTGIDLHYTTVIFSIMNRYYSSLKKFNKHLRFYILADYHLVIEKPQVYSSCHQKGDQNFLINLSIVCGVVISEAARLNIDLIIYTPHEWKGSRPKTIDNKYTLSLLTNDEKKAFEHSVIKTAKSKRHNVIDAIGIGLRFLNRR